MIENIKEVENGSYSTRLMIYSCDRCGISIPEYHPHTKTSKNHYCLECSFILKKISEESYISCVGIALDGVRAVVIDGEVNIWLGTPPWERSDKDERNSLSYKKWRTSVFERDEYTCQHCGQVGGELNAHHIKPFAKYKDLRYEITNGLTLCVTCHREVHRKR